MNVGANYMREHIKETSRIHYVITNGGGQPNVVPATAQVWYYVRANTHEDVERQFDWLTDIAEGGAKMSRTKVQRADRHRLPRDHSRTCRLSKVVQRNFESIGPPKFDEADRDLARQLQEPLRAEFGLKEAQAAARHDRGTARASPTRDARLDRRRRHQLVRADGRLRRRPVSPPAVRATAGRTSPPSARRSATRA